MDIRRELLHRYLGQKVHIIVDRPLGYDHKGIVYPVNYGYLPGVIAGDGEEQDAYILGITVPLAEFDGVVIGAAVRRDDVEDKLIVAPEGMHFSREEMARALNFQEQYFDSLILLPED